MATKIIINRKSEFVNRARGFKVIIDGKEVGKLPNGGSEEFQVAPGPHMLLLKIDWCCSPELNFEIKEGETQFFITGSGMKYYSYGVIILLISFLASPALKLMNIPRPVNFSIIQFLMLLPLLLYMLYYLTVGRKKYIELKVDKNNLFN